MEDSERNRDEMEAVEMASEDGDDCEAGDGGDDSDAGDGGDGGGGEEVYLPGQPIQDGEELVHDSSAYHMYHAAQTGAPCLSFDILRDSLGDNRTIFPMTAYLVAGTQAESKKQNFMILMKMSQLNPTNKQDDSDSEDELEDDEPQLDMTMIQHSGAVNRIRAAPLTEHTLIASWSEKGVVNIWNADKHMILLDRPSASAKSLSGHKEAPLYSFTGHQTEGYAVDWSSTTPGRLATGDCHSNIHVWTPTDDGSWRVDQRSYSAHSKSVEDIQWSPNEASVFASCSVDGTVRVWDVRATPSKACMITCHAHSDDVNVISWNRSDPLLLSGGEDGIVKVWDLRQIKKEEAAAVFKHHTAPVTSVEWHPSDSTVFASAGDDNQVVQWDLAVEREESGAQSLDVPPQLLFIHQGQQEIKEVHWHPQLPGVLVSTAINGFNVFKTISV